jgi:hypothetical protein
MIYKAVEGVLFPDGRLTMPGESLPAQPVRVMVTLLEDRDDADLASVGDYSDQLASYEERLARGDVQWQ